MGYEEELAVGLFILGSVLLAIFIIPGIFYCLTLQRTLEAVAPENRKMQPGQVWLLFIPLFHLVWHFFVVSYVADSLRAEFASRGITPDESRPGFGIGLAASILWVLGIGFVALILWIIYWVKIAEYKNKLNASGIGQRSGGALDSGTF
ncbi:MAG: hypothetical protein AB1458_01635 [Bacteroidota bacterium]